MSRCPKSCCCSIDYVVVAQHACQQELAVIVDMSGRCTLCTLNDGKLAVLPNCQISLSYLKGLLPLPTSYLQTYPPTNPSVLNQII